MYTIHSLHEMQMTSRSPSIHIPREVLRDLGPEGRDRVINALEAAGAPRRRLACGVVARAVSMRWQALDAALVRLLEGVVTLWRRQPIGNASSRISTPNARG